MDEWSLRKRKEAELSRELSSNAVLTSGQNLFSWLAEPRRAELGKSLAPVCGLEVVGFLRLRR